MKSCMMSCPWTTRTVKYSIMRRQMAHLGYPFLCNVLVKATWLLIQLPNTLIRRATATPKVRGRFGAQTHNPLRKGWPEFQIIYQDPGANNLLKGLRRAASSNDCSTTAQWPRTYSTTASCTMLSKADHGNRAKEDENSKEGKKAERGNYSSSL